MAWVSVHVASLEDIYGIAQRTTEYEHPKKLEERKQVVDTDKKSPKHEARLRMLLLPKTEWSPAPVLTLFRH